jgi:hypothetical protein
VSIFPFMSLGTHSERCEAEHPNAKPMTNGFT